MAEPRAAFRRMDATRRAITNEAPTTKQAVDVALSACQSSQITESSPNTSAHNVMPARRTRAICSQNRIRQTKYTPNIVLVAPRPFFVNCNTLPVHLPRPRIPIAANLGKIFDEQDRQRQQHESAAAEHQLQGAARRGVGDHDQGHDRMAQRLDVALEGHGRKIRPDDREQPVEEDGYDERVVAQHAHHGLRTRHEDRAPGNQHDREEGGIDRVAVGRVDRTGATPAAAIERRSASPSRTARGSAATGPDWRARVSPDRATAIRGCPGR